MTILASEDQPIVADRCQLQRVLVVDEYELVQAGLRAVLLGEPWVASCLGTSSPEIAWQIIRRRQPQLVVVSTSLPDRAGFTLCRELKERLPHIRVVLMSTERPLSSALALKYGAMASLPKQLPPASIVAAIKRVAEGARVFPKDQAPRVQLSRRELDILQHLATGLSNPEVAALLSLSRWTVKQHTSAVYKKLAVRNRAEAASRAQELGLLR